MISNRHHIDSSWFTAKIRPQEVVELTKIDALINEIP